jgi:hypothetical protein
MWFMRRMAFASISGGPATATQNMQIEHAHLTSYYRGARIALHFVETRGPRRPSLRRRSLSLR